MRTLWVVVPLLVLCLGFAYIGRRLIGPIGLEPRRKKIAWIALGGWMAILYATLLLGRTAEGWSGSLLSWIAYLSLGLLSIIVTTLLIRDIFWIIGRAITGTGAFIRRRRGGVAAEVDHSRRRNLLHMTNMGVLGIAGVLMPYGVFEARRRPGIVQVTVPIRGLPDAFAGFRIVQITDIHAGLTVGREWIETIAAEVQGLNPDLIAFTGDIADGSVPHLRDAVAPFGGLHAPYGKFFVTGNHEYYSGAEEWVAEVKRLGYDVLMNEHRLVERNGAAFVLAGVTDYTAGNYIPSHTSDPAAAFQGAPSDLVRIFLAHQPKTLRKSEDIHYDLMLSGHTHGGQFFPWNLAAAADQPYISGLHMHDRNGKQIYVSKGTGYWGPPVRLGARSEVTVITLMKG
jgi:predicted MPP superfamily phosphohydrolase